MEIHIYDKIKTQNTNHILPLSSLVELIWSIDPNLLSGYWNIYFAHAGHGEKAVQLDDLVCVQCPYLIDGEQIFPWIKDGTNYLDHFGAQSETQMILGIFDASFLFIDTDNDFVLDKVKQHYFDIQIVQDDEKSIKRLFVT